MLSLTIAQEWHLYHLLTHSAKQQQYLWSPLDSVSDIVFQAYYSRFDKAATTSILTLTYSFWKSCNIRAICIGLTTFILDNGKQVLIVNKFGSSWDFVSYCLCVKPLFRHACAWVLSFDLHLILHPFFKFVGSDGSYKTARVSRLVLAFRFSTAIPRTCAYTCI